MKLSTVITAVIVIAGAFVAGEITAGVKAHQSLATYEDSLHHADRAIAQRDTELAIAKSRTDSVTRSVTALLAAARVDTMWRHDTLHIAGDTTLRLAIPLPTVLRQDSTNAACELLAVTCKAERVAAENRADAAEHKLQIVLNKPERSCVHAFWFGAAAGAASDELAHGRLRIPLLSFTR